MEDKKLEIKTEESKEAGLEAYKDLVDGLAKVGESLVAIGNDETNYPVKLLIGQLISKLGFNDPDVGDLIGMIRFAVDNDDLGLEKLTAKIAGV
jgi:hypothetical protein